MTPHEWQPAISCKAMKLIAPTASGDFEISLINLDFAASPNRSDVVLKYCSHEPFLGAIPSHQWHNLGTVVYKVLEGLKKEWPGGLGFLRSKSLHPKARGNHSPSG
jgi:hypothetical protein